jgi:LacI family transcriptional regulator
MTPTLDQIAAELNVSRSTVSYVLLGKSQEKRISRAMAERVMAAAERLNYKPDGAARSLYERKSYQVGLLLRNAADRPLTTPSAFEFIMGVNLELEQAGYVLTLIRIGDVHAEGEPQSRVFREHMLDGIMIFGDLPTSIFEQTKRLSEACVWANSSAFGPQRCIRRDEVEAGRMSAQMALQNGYTRLVWVGIKTTPSDTAFPDERPHYSDHDRYVGVMAGAGRPGIVCESVLLNRHVSQDTLRTAMQRLASPDTAFIAYDSGLAMRCILAASELGLRLGQDLGLVCCDEWEILRTYWPSMSRVSHDLLGMGKAAAQMLLKVIADPKTKCPSVQVQGAWYPGTTLAGPERHGDAGPSRE